MQTIQEFYEQNIRVKSAPERLQLATLILNDISPEASTDYSETWTDEDIEDFRNASSAYMLDRLAEKENASPSAANDSEMRRDEDIEIALDANAASISSPLNEQKNFVSSDVTADVETVAAYCKAVLNLKAANLSVEYAYPCLPFCVIDSVYSIGVRYEGVQNVIARYREHLQLSNLAEESHTIAEFVEFMQKHGVEQCADNIFRNRQRTSARNGILKAEAVLQFAGVLHERGIDTREDAKALIDDAEFEQAICAIPGQGSGISLKYFFMLCGSTDYIKPDRMVCRFLERALGRRVGMEEAVTLLRQASRILQQEYSDMSPRALDGEIWKYQRQQ